MARVVKPPLICDRLIEACRYEYRTRNLIDGRIVQCDQRISIVAGYLTEEVSGLSPFTFIHRDDVRWVMVALRQSKFLFLFLYVFSHILFFAASWCSFFYFIHFHCVAFFLPQQLYILVIKHFLFC
jgi:hypothetical protein